MSNIAKPSETPALVAPIPVPPVPPRIAEGGAYDTCLAMVDDDPEGAIAFAESWAADGRGGDGAVHCRALATITLGDPARAAAMLDQLAASSAGPAAARASIAGQAAQAWMMANAPDHAYDSASVALDLYGDDPDLLVERATACVQLGRNADAIADLDRALTLDPSRDDALVLRATAHRSLGAYDAARADVTAALTRDPDNPAALLERGVIRQHDGDLEGARQDFERTMTLSPDTGVAELAQQNIALLDAGPADR